MAFAFKVRSIGEGYTPPLVPDLSLSRAALSILADPENGCQITSIPSGRREPSLIGSNIDGLVKQVEKLFPVGRWVYCRLNPVAVGSTKGNVPDILSRRWLMLDCDAERPDSGQPSTDDEHERARKLLDFVVADLSSIGWPLPVIIDSGNGWTGLYRVDLPNTDESRELCKNVLAAIASRFHGWKGATVDRDTYKATQEIKVPGTWAQKGKNTEERPYRKVRMTDVPVPVVVVSPLLLEAMAITAPPKPKKSDPPTPWLVRSVLPDEEKRQRAYAQGALESEFRIVADALPGSRNRILNRAAFNLGGFVKAGLLFRQEVECRLTEACSINRLDQDPGCGPNGIAATIRSGLTKSMEEPRKVPDATAVNGNGKHEEKKPEAKPEEKKTEDRPAIYSLPDLLALELPEPRWAVPGLLAEGLFVLAGKPKLGKSWCALNLALNIMAGGMALGKIQTESGDVLYLSLEDRLRRIQDRARKLVGSLGVEPSGKLSIATAWPKQDRKGLDYVGEWMATAENPRLVIIDVWVKFRPSYKTSGNLYDQDYDSAHAVKQLADAYGCSLLILHHCKKAAAEDVVDEISGTLGLAGAADGLLILTRARSETEASLFVTGRDIDENELALEFNKQTFAWTITGNTKERTASKVKAAIMAIFRQSGGSQFWPREMAEAIEAADFPNVDHAVVKTTMWRMAQEGELFRKNGKYGWPLPGQESVVTEDDDRAEF